MTKYKCPKCGDANHVEIDTHSEGYIKDLFECYSCGCCWIVVDDTPEVLCCGSLPE